MTTTTRTTQALATALAAQIEEAPDGYSAPLLKALRFWLLLTQDHQPATATTDVDALASHLRAYCDPAKMAAAVDKVRRQIEAAVGR